MRVLPRFLVAFAFLAASSAYVSCSHVPPSVVSTVKDCADKVTHAVAGGIVDDVSHAMLCDFSNTAELPACLTAQLVAIAARAGWAAVDCVISDVQASATLNAKASMDPTELVRARRANAAAAWRARSTGSP